MNGFNIREGMYKEYQDFLQSTEFKKLVSEVLKETGARYMSTYGTIIPSSLEQGDYDAYEFVELPNHAALDKMRTAKSMRKLAALSYKYIESRPTKTVLLRKMNEVKVTWEPQKK
jgi:hypothetical protein